MYKLIACDLDETLLDDHAHVCQRNKDAIEAATKLGVKFVPATGRGYNAIAQTLDEINLKDKANEYVISFNGGCITENKGNRIMKFQGLSWDKANELYQLGLKYNVCIHVYTKDMLYVYHADEEELNYIKLRHAYQIIDDQDLDFLKGQEIAKVLYGNPDVPYLEKIANEISSSTKDLDVSYSSNRYLEFNHQGVNKGAGLIWLANKLGIKLEETMALGDNFNDLSMIKAAGLGVGVANVNPQMKNECDFVTNADYKEGGVGEAIEKFVLNNK
ncbi:Cof-type HAD-IIB family hydrolase [Lactobacillus ultunensis]|uniref:Cof-like hydrolase n=1 Tax=Lactobacillus ultunensis DSM 16047 TaxID=525365 RepID=C2EN69_9LACO|nr:Cof-type HAD-IIB family hydrolase [Lactobacillus ultunensis]EEJ72023.1 Cof-like hydrolase [Lactobacillus ultunensis DSM 16047]KRL80469.1 HAD family hydrolase [Lactobacillus ultunensis DSM 16047]QQP27710.1 Cof-type HAD-IIB family hydrolase [Lactobacillus ultunensis]